MFAKILSLLIALPLAAAQAGTGFRWSTDSLAFPNQTYRVYGYNQRGEWSGKPRAEQIEYGRRCFVLARTVMQFHKFARFDPAAPKASDGEYRRIIRHLSRIPVWLPEWRVSDRVVVPGFPNLREFSHTDGRLLKEELGNFWPSYMRVGNWRMGFPFPRSGQAGCVRETVGHLDRGELQALYLARWPHLNHCVVVYDYKRLPDGNYEFFAYDPNIEFAPMKITFDSQRRSFLLPGTRYYPGGQINAFRCYVSPVR